MKWLTKICVETECILYQKIRAADWVSCCFAEKALSLANALNNGLFLSRLVRGLFQWQIHLPLARFWQGAMHLDNRISAVQQKAEKTGTSKKTINQTYVQQRRWGVWKSAKRRWCAANIQKPKRASPICWKNLFGFILPASLLQQGQVRYHVGDEWSLISRRIRCT